MREPYRIPAVTIGLELYRQVISALADAIVAGGRTAWPVARRGMKRGASELRRLTRPSGELVPSLIEQRLRDARLR